MHMIPLLNLGSGPTDEPAPGLDDATRAGRLYIWRAQLERCTPVVRPLRYRVFGVSVMLTTEIADLNRIGHYKREAEALVVPSKWDAASKAALDALTRYRTEPLE